MHNLRALLSFMSYALLLTANIMNMLTDSSCTGFEITKFGLNSSKTNCYMGGLNGCGSYDESLSFAFVNSDKNHISFCFPDLLHEHSLQIFNCKHCENASLSEFCSNNCRANYLPDLQKEYPLCVTRKPYHKYRFTML